MSEKTQSVPISRKQKGNKAKSSAQPLSSKSAISVFAGVLIGVLVAGPLFIANARFFSAIKANDIKAVESAGYSAPKDERRIFMLAGIFRNAKLDDQAVRVLREATVEYPDSFDLWTLWTTIPAASPADLATAKAQLKRLDPFNPAFK